MLLHRRSSTSWDPTVNQHKFEFDQHVEYEGPNDFPPTMRVVAKLASVCKTHNAPHYGCVHGDGHYMICEGHLKPLSPTNRKKLN